jgi:hypothetical protein
VSEMGLNQDHMKQLAKSLLTADNDLSASRSAIASAVAVTWWSGARAEAFRSEWNARLSPRLQGAGEMLKKVAAAVDVQLAEQQRTSEATGSASIPGTRATTTAVASSPPTTSPPTTTPPTTTPPTTTPPTTSAPSVRKTTHHTKRQDIQEMDIPEGTARSQFTIPKWPGQGVTRVQLFINDGDVCMIPTPRVASTCGRGDDRTFASGPEVGDYNLGSRVRLVLDHENGIAHVLAYPTHENDGSESDAVPIVLIESATNQIPPPFPSSVRTFETKNGAILFDYLFYNSKANEEAAGIVPGIYGGMQIERGTNGQVVIEAKFSQYPSIEIIRDHGDGEGGFNSILIFTKQQNSGSPKSLFYPTEDETVTG